MSNHQFFSNGWIGMENECPSHQFFDSRVYWKWIINYFTLMIIRYPVFQNSFWSILFYKSNAMVKRIFSRYGHTLIAAIIYAKQKNPLAVPFGTLLALLSLWMFISTPLTFLGAYFGFKASVRSYSTLFIFINNLENSSTCQNQPDPTTSTRANTLH